MSAAALKEAVTSDSTAVAKKPEPKNFPAMLETWKGEIARALPRHLNADRMARIALTCFRNVPKLAECDPHSVFAAVLQSAQLGIEPGLMGEAHLIPYGKTCQLIPGYQGLIKLAKQTGQVVDIYAMAVREKDKFSCTYGLNRTLDHQPLSKAGGFPASVAERGEIIGVYAVAVFKDGTRTFTLLGKDEIDRVRDGSQGYKTALKYGKKDTPWIAHYEEMALKTAIRRLCKMLPKSPELAQAIALEDAHNQGRAQNIDMASALDGSYSAPGSDVVDADVIDETTGEITKPAANDAPQQPVGGPPKFAMKDAMRLINEGDYVGARQLVNDEKGQPHLFKPANQAEVEACIKKHQAGEKV
jgi:recombination protein RecT